MRDNRKVWFVIAVFFSFIVLWASVILAPTLGGGLTEMVPKMREAIAHPFRWSYCSATIPCVAISLTVYGFGVLIYHETKPKRRRREEHGSAEWGNIKQIKKRYAQIPFSSNKILTQNTCIGYDAKKHRRNMNTLVVGGSGAGKTRFYAKPNIMQANTSFVVLDPKGEILRDTGNLLEKKGYEIRVLDLINMPLSHCYNPLCYLESDNDVQRLVTNLFKATTPKGSTSTDPFWDTAASMLLLALIFFVRERAIPEEQNFPTIMELLRAGEINEDKSSEPSILDELFSEFEELYPGHIALKYYKSYRSGAAKTLKSIQITLASRLEKFNLESLASLCSADELDLKTLGTHKVALFALIPDNDTSFNFLVSILYTQLFQQLFKVADKDGGCLPIPVHFMMDEFANVSLPDDFDKILSVMRSRGVSVSIIVQNMAQLKALFEKQWESIVGNCDEFVYLGGNEQSTHKYVSELLGKATIDINTYGRSDGLRGNFTTNYQLLGREILTPDEVRMLDNKYAVLFIRGERPI
ncbi:MAG: type IV secretory system conjugative DNA transfer family protein, partial [Clostridia bacterium]|nr:type IV secretory system conjugative DNA transfer family protein [Clostridia bacterium]